MSKKKPLCFADFCGLMNIPKKADEIPLGKVLSVIINNQYEENKENNSDDANRNTEHPGVCNIETPTPTLESLNHFYG